MHVAILTYGSRGDVQPFVALGEGFSRAGHSVRLCAPEKLGVLIRSSETRSRLFPGADVVVHSFLLTIAGHEIARERNIPDIGAQTFPVFRSTTEFPSAAFPDLPLGGTYRRITHWVTSQTFWPGSRFLYRRIRLQHPDLPPLSGCPFSSTRKRKTPLLFAFSPHVLPKPSVWDVDAMGRDIGSRRRRT